MLHDLFTFSWLLGSRSRTESKLRTSIKGLLPLHFTVELLNAEFTVTNRGALCPALAWPSNNQGSHGLSQCLYGTQYHSGFQWSGSWLGREAPSAEMAPASHLALCSLNGRMVPQLSGAIS